MSEREDGVNSGVRNIGRFFLALIPWALGLGALVWMSVWIGVHTYRHEMAQQDRAATYDGSKERPSAKLKVDVRPKTCIHLIREDVDGDTLYLYARNDCPVSHGDYMEWHWQSVSPNGVIVKEGYTNSCPVPSQPKDVAECKIWNYEADDRTDTLRVWVER